MRKLVLIIEDNPDIIFNIKLMLEFNNFEVITALNGKEGMKLLLEDNRLPDIIVCDIMMPEMDGYEVFKKVSTNSIFKNIPFLFLTAKASKEEEEYGKLLGVKNYLKKPFKDEELLEKLISMV